MENIIKNIEDELECPICLEQIFQPMTLACLHSFCYECVDRLFSKAKKSKTLCPLCQEEAHKTDVRNDIFKNKIIDIINRESPIIKGDFKFNYHFSYPWRNEIFVSIHFMIDKNHRKWLHYYVRYSIDDWKSYCDLEVRDIHPLIELPHKFGQCFYVPQNTELISFAVCVYDDYNHSYWDNNNGLNYNFKPYKIE